MPEETHNKHRNLYQRLVEVMRDLPKVEKSGKAAGEAGGYPYVRHEELAAAVRPLCVKHGVVVFTDVQDHEYELLEGQKLQIFTRVRVGVVFINADAPEQRETVTSYGYGIDRQDKGIGKAVTYAVKQALQKCLLVAAGEDVEADSFDIDGAIAPAREPQAERAPARRAAPAKAASTPPPVPAKPTPSKPVNGNGGTKARSASVNGADQLKQFREDIAEATKAMGMLDDVATVLDHRYGAQRMDELTVQQAAAFRADVLERKRIYEGEMLPAWYVIGNVSDTKQAMGGLYQQLCSWCERLDPSVTRPLAASLPTFREWAVALASEAEAAQGAQVGA